MESREQREPQGTPQDLEQGTPQDELVNDEPAPDEGGADSAADAVREGG